MENNEICVLVGNHFANTMQFVVAVVSLTVLVFHKIFIEDNACSLKSRLIQSITRKPPAKYKPGRPWKLWLMDNTKQGLSSSIAHIYATYIAVLFSHGTNDGDPCAWFLIQFLIDTALGVFLSFGLSKLSIFLIGECNQPLAKRWLTVGNYYTMSHRQIYFIWGVQVFHWLVFSLLARLICSLILLATLPIWNSVAFAFSQPWQHNRHAELVFVVLGMPILMNSVQFLLTNWYLRWKRPNINNDSLREALNS